MDTSETHALLRELVEQQRRQLVLQAEAIELQRSHMERAQAQFAQAERINAGAAALQRRAATAIRLVLWIALPVTLALLLLLAWPLLRHLS